jgi:hypothetical protein
MTTVTISDDTATVLKKVQGHHLARTGVYQTLDDILYMVLTDALSSMEQNGV